MDSHLRGSITPRENKQQNSGFTLSYQDGKFNFISHMTIKELYLGLGHFYLLQNIGSVEIVDNLQKFL